MTPRSCPGSRSLSPKPGSSDEKGPAARRRPKAAGEAYLLYVEPAAEGANEADGPLSSLEPQVDLGLELAEETERRLVVERKHLGEEDARDVPGAIDPEAVSYTHLTL